MDHIAILKKSWKLIPKILSGEKKVESRWYLSRCAPWNRIEPGDKLYFKDSGEPVTVVSRVVKVDQYEIVSHEQAIKTYRKYLRLDLGVEEISEEAVAYLTGKKYALFIFFDQVKEIEPFNIDKKGFGAISAWLTVENISQIKRGTSL